MNYVPNNIEFRIVSSNAIAKFRQQQAFIFNELIRNPKGSFSHSSREILLLNYDMWFKWILRTEKMFLTSICKDGHIVNCEPYLASSLESVVEEIGDVVQTAPELFAPNVEQLLKFQRPYIDFAKQKMVELHNHTIYMAYPKIVTTITDILYDLLHIIHESERIGDEKPFLSLTKNTLGIFNATGILPIIDRGQVYREALGTSEFALKNYTEKPLDQEILTKLKNEGFIVTAFL